MYQKIFSKSIEQHINKLPFQAHSHHFWPDSGLKGVIQCWEDSIKLADTKWEKIFNQVIPQAKNHILKSLNLKNQDQIVFAQNSHELIYRWLSSFSQNDLSILTTDSEFYSLGRQLSRFKEEGVQVNYVETSSAKGESAEIANLIIEHVQRLRPKVLIFSHVFFNSGFMIKLEDIQRILEQAPQDTHILIDGYHAFATRNFDLSKIIQRAYYCAGGYKYAMVGEGACFLITPENCQLRPRNTGWFANLEQLKNMDQKINYPGNAHRFLGSTFDSTSLYRLNAVWDHFESLNLSLEDIHSYVLKLQKHFIKNLKNKDLLLLNDINSHAHFFTLQFESPMKAQDFSQELSKRNVLMDQRKNLIRLGFGIYQTIEQVDKLLNILNE